MDLMAQLAEECVIEDSTSATGVFTQQQLDFIFTAGLRLMDLPVGSSGQSSTSQMPSTGNLGHSSKSVCLIEGQDMLEDILDCADIIECRDQVCF